MNFVVMLESRVQLAHRADRVGAVHALPVDKLMTGTLALDDINRGFDLLHEGNAVRQVVVFS